MDSILLASECLDSRLRVTNLDQGDPLWPLLFVSVMEALRLSKVIEGQYIQGFTVEEGQLRR